MKWDIATVPKEFADNLTYIWMGHKDLIFL